MRSDDKTREELKEAYTRREDTSGARFIPAKQKSTLNDVGKRYRVCAYCRVSTDNDEQLSSFELQQEHYQQLVGNHPNWDLKHIYADEGISGTSMKKREEFNEMIALCKKGEYDLIVTKSVSRFARNLVDCVSLVRELKAQNPPVGVFFETDNLFTLSEDSELMLSLLATFAQEESTKKRESMIWSLHERFKNKKLLTPELFGYERPRDAGGHYIKYGQLMIVEEEAEVVRFIYNAFLGGYSIESIASILTDLGIPTKTGNTNWSISSVSYILSNERYCGDVLTWKTFTVDVFEHKKRKNNQDRDQFLYSNVHPAIVTTEQFEAAQTLLANRRNGLRGGVNPRQVIEDGVFQGYVPINHRWINDDPNIYYEASDSVRKGSQTQKIQRSFFSAFDLTGYQVVRGQFLTARSELPCMTITSDKITFNSQCGKKMVDIENIQLLLHPTERRIAIRPCEKEDVFSITWKTNTDHPILFKTLNSPHFCNALFQIMEWNPEYHYRILGTWIHKRNDRIMIFNLSNAMPIATMFLNPEETRRKRMPICPEEWGDTFGQEFYDFSAENSLYYSSNNVRLGSAEKCHVVAGQEDFQRMTQDEVVASVARLRARGEAHANENQNPNDSEE